MLRSLDPEKNFQAPKSRRFRPTTEEAKKFSKNELSYIEDATHRDEDLLIERAIKAEQREILLAKVREKKGKDS